MSLIVTHPIEFPRFEDFRDGHRALVQNLEEYRALCKIHGTPAEWAVLEASVDPSKVGTDVLDKTESMIQVAMAAALELEKKEEEKKALEALPDLSEVEALLNPKQDTSPEGLNEAAKDLGFSTQGVTSPVAKAPVKRKRNAKNST